MRKITAILTLLLCSVMVFAGKVLPNDITQLPDNAQKFIQMHFQKLVIQKIELDEEILDAKIFEVKFTNGHQVGFDSKGVWVFVDCVEDPIPEKLIPMKIFQYIKTNFPGDFITQIVIEKNGYDIELQSDISLKFDKKENFKSVDN